MSKHPFPEMVIEVLEQSIATQKEMLESTVDPHWKLFYEGEVKFFEKSLADFIEKQNRPLTEDTEEFDEEKFKREMQSMKEEADKIYTAIYGKLTNEGE